MRNKKIIFLLITLFFLSNIFFINPKSSATKKDNTFRLIGNYIKLKVFENNGSFILYGKKNINNDWIPLLYETAMPTSYFRFSADQKRIPFGESGKGITSDIEIRDKTIYYFWQEKRIKVEIVYQLIPSVIKSNADTLLIDLNILNLTGKDYKIDFFLCLDTYLGENSKDHFFLSDNLIINYEKEIIDTTNINIIRSFDKKQNLGVDILFDKNEQVIPSRIFFANWKKVEKSKGNYKVIEKKDFTLKPDWINNSAVFIDYNNQVIYPKKDNKYKFKIKMQNNMDFSKEKKEEKIQIIDDKNLKDIELINLSLKDLLEILDNINNKLYGGAILTDQDIELTKKILKEVKKRRNLE